MVESIVGLREKEDKTVRVRGKDLILSIDRSGKIVSFNEECERVSGYSKEEVFNNRFFDFLVPKRYLDVWEKMVKYIRRNKLIDDFKLPLLTRNGHEIMISWSSFPVKDRNGRVGDIGFVGKFVSSWDDSSDSINVKPSKRVEVGSKDDVDFGKIVKQLEKRNIELEKKNKDLEKKLKRLESKLSKKEEKSGKVLDRVDRGLYRFFDVFGWRKKREELNALMQELDEREKQLKKLEDKLNKEKISIDERRNKFVRWREKLEMLENEIYNRERELERQRGLIEVGSSVSDDVSIVEGGEEVEYHGILDKIQDCAAVVQRGILRQVNKSFTDLLGYEAEEVVDKSLFDFIDPEGFLGLEKYYLNRLKGEDVSSFETVFLTKDNNKVFVEVSTRPIRFNDEKAELAVFKEIKILK